MRASPCGPTDASGFTAPYRVDRPAASTTRVGEGVDSGGPVSGATRAGLTRGVGVESMGMRAWVVVGDYPILRRGAKKKLGRGGNPCAG